MARNGYRQGKKQVNVVMSDVLHRQLVTSAAARGLTMQEVVVEAVRDWITAQAPSAAAKPLDVFAAEEEEGAVTIRAIASDDFRTMTPLGYTSSFTDGLQPFGERIDIAAELAGPKPKIVDMDVYNDDGTITRSSFVMPYENVPFEETP